MAIPKQPIDLDKEFEKRKQEAVDWYADQRVIGPKYINALGSAMAKGSDEVLREFLRINPEAFGIIRRLAMLKLTELEVERCRRAGHSLNRPHPGNN